MNTDADRVRTYISAMHDDDHDGQSCRMVGKSPSMYQVRFDDGMTYWVFPEEIS